MRGILQRTAQEYKMFSLKSVHELGMVGPAILFSHYTFRVPARSLLVNYDKESHFPLSFGETFFDINLG